MRSVSGPESALISSLITADAVGRSVTDDEIADDLAAILFGGMETVPKVLAGALLEADIYRMNDSRRGPWRPPR